MGCVTIYTPELGAEICARIASGRSLRSVCEDADMPAKSTFFLWVPKYEDLQLQYQIAKECRADTYAEECIEIADDGTNDYMRKVDGEGHAAYIVNGENIARSRLRVDTRKWIAAKLYPKTYGDRVNTVLTGKDGGPVQIENPNAPTLADFYQTVKRIAVDDDTEV